MRGGSQALNLGIYWGNPKVDEKFLFIEIFHQIDGKELAPSGPAALRTDDFQHDALGASLAPDQTTPP